MLQFLSLRRYQKHKKRKLRFAPDVTVLVGKTGAGKSCCYRALRTALLNNPSGEKLVHKRKGGCSVVVRIDGHKIVRRRGVKLNTYSLDGKVFRAFGNKVPPEIADLVQASELNFQGQHDQAFWFTLSPGQVSKQLNQIVNLEEIDKVLDRAAAAVRKAKATLDVTKDRYRAAKREDESLAWVDEFVKDVKRLQGRADHSAALLIKRDLLRGLYSDGHRLASAADLASKAITCAEKAARAARLRGLIGHARKLSQVKKVALPDMETLVNIRAQADKAAEDRRALEYLVTLAQEAHDRLCETTNILEKASKAADRVKVCPTCGTPMLSRSVPVTSTLKKKPR